MVIVVHASRSINFRYHKSKRSLLEAAESSSLTIARLLWLYIYRFSQY